MVGARRTSGFQGLWCCGSECFAGPGFINKVQDQDTAQETVWHAREVEDDTRSPLPPLEASYHYDESVWIAPSQLAPALEYVGAIDALPALPFSAATHTFTAMVPEGPSVGSFGAVASDSAVAPAGSAADCLPAQSPISERSPLPAEILEVSPRVGAMDSASSSTRMATLEDPFGPIGAAAALGELQGEWVRRGRADWVHTVVGTDVMGPDGSCAPCCALGGGIFSMTVEGVQHKGRLQGARLLWDDGDVWISKASSVAFDGLWFHQRTPMAHEFIKGDALYGLDGTVAEVIKRTTTSITISIGAYVHHAELRPSGELVWDDGDIWIKPSISEVFDGRWRGGPNRRHNFIIAEDCIYGPDGVATPIVDRASDGIVVVWLAKRHRGDFNGREIHWDNGDVWARVDGHEGGDGELDPSEQALWIAQVRRVSHDREEEILEELKTSSLPACVLETHNLTIA